MLNDSYVAGFFDGEGSVVIIVVRVKKHGRIYYQFRPLLKMSQKYRPVLDSIRSYLGTCSVTGNALNGYRYVIQSVEHIIKVADRLLQWSLVKRDSLRVVRRFCEFQQSKVRKNTPYSRQEIETMIALRDELLNLNEMTREKQLKRIVYTPERILGETSFVDDYQRWNEERLSKLTYAAKQYWTSRKVIKGVI